MAPLKTPTLKHKLTLNPEEAIYRLEINWLKLALVGCQIIPENTDQKSATKSLIGVSSSCKISLYVEAGVSICIPMYTYTEGVPMKHIRQTLLYLLLRLGGDPHKKNTHFMSRPTSLFEDLTESHSSSKRVCVLELLVCKSADTPQPANLYGMQKPQKQNPSEEGAEVMSQVA